MRSLILIIINSLVLYAQGNNWMLFEVIPAEPHNSILCMKQDLEDNIWIGTSNYGLLNYNWDDWVIYDRCFSNTEIWGMSFDSLNNIWLATTQNGLLYYNSVTNEITDSINILDLAPRAHSNHSWDVKIDRFNNIWAGTYWGGLLRYNGVEWINYNATNSQLSIYQEEINSIAIDYYNNIWCATDYGGIFMFDRDSSFFKYDTLWWYNSLLVDQNNAIWGAGNYFIKIEEGGNFFNFWTASPPHIVTSKLSHQTIHSDGEGNIWIAGFLDYSDSTSNRNGIIKFDGENFHSIINRVLNDDNNHPTSIFVDSFGNKWIGFNRGQIVVYNENGIKGIPTDVSTETLPASFKLYQNYPNPFNPTTIIKFTIPLLGGARGGLIPVSIKLFDILGREIKTLVNRPHAPGNYKIEFDGSNLASGVYFYRLNAGDFISTKKMMLLR